MKITRDEWLNNAAELNIDFNELGNKLGLYTLEAMEIIDNDSNTRTQILLSEKSSQKEKNEALKTGVWYSNDYLTFIKNYKERFDWMMNKKVLNNGFMTAKLWQQVESTNFLKEKTAYAFMWKDNKSSPAEEILNILEGKSLCLLECATVFNLAQYAALLRVWGKTKFDRVFSGEEEFTLPLRLSNFREINPIYLFLSGEKVRDTASLRIGDKMGIGNHPDYSKKHGNGSGNGWNLVCAEVSPTIKFVGFGLNGKRLTIDELEDVLIDEYNEEPFNDKEILPKELQIQNNGASSKILDKITKDDFVKSQNTGLDFSIVRLDPEKVKMILTSSEHLANLLKVAKNTHKAALSYAMEPKIREKWKIEGDSPSQNKNKMI